MKKDKNIQRISKLIENIVKKTINEEYSDSEELSGIEEYEQGYPNSDFDASTLNKQELISWCQNVGDFLYIYNMPFGGWRISAANSEPVQNEIIGDVAHCNHIEVTHEMDSMLWRKEREFDMFYVAVVKLCFDNKSEDYYIIYEVEK